MAKITSNACCVERELLTGVTARLSLISPPVMQLLELLTEVEELGSSEIHGAMQLKDRTHLREHYIILSL